MIPSIYDQFIKKIPHDSERTYDPTFQMPVVDTVPSDLREWVGTSSLDRSRTVTCSRLGEGGPSSQNHHVEQRADDEIDLGNGNVSEYEIEIRPSAKGAGDGDGDGVEWGEGEEESGTDDKGDRDQVERKDKKKEERVWKKPKGKEALREYNNQVAISQRETQNLLDSYVDFVRHLPPSVLVQADSKALRQHEKFRLSFWPEYVPDKCRCCDIAADHLGPLKDGILSRKGELKSESESDDKTF